MGQVIEININLVFTIINLIVLYLLMKKVLFGPILNVMEQRKNMVDQQFASAKDTEEQGYELKGKYEDALKYLDKFSAKDQLVSPAILGTIGNCYAEMGQLDKAAGTLLKAADKADSQALSPIYLIQAGQLFEKLGKNSEAVKAYTLVKEKYFNSYQSMDIDKYIERASIK